MAPEVIKVCYNLQMSYNQFDFQQWLLFILCPLIHHGYIVLKHVIYLNKEIFLLKTKKIYLAVYDIQTVYLLARMYS